MTTPLIFQFLDNVIVGVEKKITGELVNWLFALLILPFARWVGTIFSRRRRRSDNRRELESLKLLYDLECTFGDMPDAHRKLYRERYQTLLAASEDMRQVMPQALVPASPAPSAGVPDDPVEAALAKPPPALREEGLSFLDWVFALSAPGLYLLIAATASDEPPEFRIVMAMAALIGAGLSVALAFAWFAGPRDRTFWEAVKQIFWSVVCFFVTLIVIGLVAGVLGIAIPGFDDPPDAR